MEKDISIRAGLKDFTYMINKDDLDYHNAMLYSIPPIYGNEIEFYYKRGNRIFLRNKDKTHTIALIMTNDEIEKFCLKYKRGSIFKLEK